VVEAALLVEATFKEYAVPVWVEPAEVSPTLVGKHAPAEQRLTGNARVEVAHERGDEAARVGEQVRMEAEGGPQDLGHGEGQHAVGQAQQEPAAQEFREKERAPLRA
jgi:hypothetical protein